MAISAIDAEMLTANSTVITETPIIKFVMDDHILRVENHNPDDKIQKVNIYNLSGQLLISQTEGDNDLFLVDMSGLSPGVYLAVAYTLFGTVSEKVAH